MELPNLPPRMELAAQPTAREARVPPQATSTAPDTLRPVLATEAPRLPAPIKGLGIAPLDLFQVGDNDEMPPPPEPPRKAAMLSIQPTPPPPQEIAEDAGDPTEDAPPPTAAPPTGLPRLVAALEEGAQQPTLDLRR